MLNERHKGVCTFLFHFYDIHLEAKLIYVLKIRTEFVWGWDIDNEAQWNFLERWNCFVSHPQIFISVSIMKHSWSSFRIWSLSKLFFPYNTALYEKKNDTSWKKKHTLPLWVWRNHQHMFHSLYQQCFGYNWCTHPLRCTSHVYLDSDFF